MTPINRKEGFDLVGTTITATMSRPKQMVEWFTPGIVGPDELEATLQRVNVEIEPESRYTTKLYGKKYTTQKFHDMKNVVGDLDDEYSRSCWGRIIPGKIVSYNLVLFRMDRSANVTIRPIQKSKNSHYESIAITLTTSPLKNKRQNAFAQDAMDAIMQAYSEKKSNGVMRLEEFMKLHPIDNV
ncbi:TPA: hypothetical protein HA251_02270 [Candidatus Woesearchaeota archaeon]|nr:hypothetical protein [Candidatus Woesearchaeota archaeon]